MTSQRSKYLEDVQRDKGFVKNSLLAFKELIPQHTEADFLCVHRLSSRIIKRLAVR